jgi:hypothetical protein
MKKYLKTFLLIFSLQNITLFSQNIYGGHLSVRDLVGSYPLGKRVQVRLAFDSLYNVNKPYTLINFGDGSPIDTAFLQSSFPLYCSGIKYLTYEVSYAYTNYGNYTITCNEGNLVSSINNIPNSVNQPLKLQYEVIITSSSYTNISAFYSGCFHSNISLSNNTYNPQSWDTDYMDSLSYIVYNNTNIPGYILPDFNVDNATGVLTYTGSSLGNYFVTLQVTEWRKLNNTRVKIGVGYRYLHLTVSSLNVGLKNYFNTIEYRIFPNPFSDILSLEQTGINSNETNKFYLIDIFGTLIFEEQINSKKQSFDLSFLSNGIYYVRIKGNSANKTFKIIKR